MLSKVRLCRFSYLREPYNEGKYITNIVRYLKEAGELTTIAQERIELMLNTANTIRVKIPVRMDPDAYNPNKPTMNIYYGYRAQHSCHLLPTQGGVILGPSVNNDQICALAMINTFKNALLKLPFGGAKGGIFVENRRTLTSGERERLLRRYTREIAQTGYCNPAYDVIGPDLGISAQDIAYMVDTFKFYHGQSNINFSGCATGKPVQIEGLEGRENAPGDAVAIQTRNALNDEFILKSTGFEQGLKGKTYIIRGLGLYGFSIAQKLEEFGAKCVGIARTGDHFIYSENGIDVQQAKHFWRVRRTLKNFPDVEYYTDFKKLMEQKCDIFIASGESAVVTEERAKILNCKLVIEALDGSITYKGAQVLKERKIPVIPDVLCSGGGVTASYFEWLRNISKQKFGMMTKKWEQKSQVEFAKQLVEGVFEQTLPQNFQIQSASELKIVQSALEEIMTTAYWNARKVSNEEGIDIRVAALKIAMNRVNKTIDLFGYAD